MVLVAIIAALIVAAAAYGYRADPAGVTSAVVTSAAAVFIHASASALAGFSAGLRVRHEPDVRRGADLTWATVWAGMAAVVLAGVGAGVLPGPWYAAGPIALAAGLTAIGASWVVVPVSRPRDAPHVGPAGIVALFPALVLPPAVVLGLLTRVVT